MCILFAICMGLVGHLVMGVPLQNPSDLFMPALDSLSLSQFFDSRIVGGSEAPKGSALHMVALVAGWQYKHFICGASLISTKVVATAAHCIVYDWATGHVLESLHGVAGTSNWNGGGIVLKFKSCKSHHKYDPATFKYDLAVITLTEAVDVDHRVQPIHLDYNHVDGGVQTYVTGWGSQTLGSAAAHQLQILFPKTLSAHQCEQLIEGIADEWWFVPPRDHHSEICTFISEGKGVCHGDSGSALVDLSSGLQIGMVLWGFPCAVGGPDIYGRVGADRDFFENAILEE